MVKTTSKQNYRTSAAALASHRNTPVAAFGDGEGQFAEIYGSSKVNATRYFIIACLAMLVAIAAVGAVMGLTPLKQIQTMVVEVDATKGVIGKPVEIEKITPNSAVIMKELADWSEAVYTIDPLRTESLFKFASARTRDKAIGQFSEFRARESVFKRMQENPGLSREVKVTSVDVSQTGLAFVFLTTTERDARGEVVPSLVKRYRLTLHYQLDPPKEKPDLLKNPLGTYVTFFNEAEERAI